MKNKFSMLSLLFLLILNAWIAPQKLTAQTAEVNFQVFYDELSPHGTWVNNPEYGYVWLPNVAPGFTPYGTSGHWVLTEDGWTWVSDYSWGWAPFHYGRWYTDAHYGPMWVPGNEWGPGWVTWRRSKGYYGWAPIGPGVSISVAYGNSYNVPHNQWRFVRDRDFGRRDINKYYVNNSNNVTIIKNSTVINNTHVNNSNHNSYNGGPDRSEVEKNSGRKFTPMKIRDDNKPGEKEEKDHVNMYRPKVNQNDAADKKPAPSKVSDMKDVKPNSQANDKAPAKNNKQQPKQKQTKDDQPPHKEHQPKQKGDNPNKQ